MLESLWVIPDTILKANRGCSEIYSGQEWGCSALHISLALLAIIRIKSAYLFILYQAFSCFLQSMHGYAAIITFQWHPISS